MICRMLTVTELGGGVYRRRLIAPKRKRDALKLAPTSPDAAPVKTRSWGKSELGSRSIKRAQYAGLPLINNGT